MMPSPTEHGEKPSENRHPVTAAASELTTAAMLAALALALSWLESIIPFQPGLPGVKLGLANLVIVYILYRMNARTALLVNVVRILLSGVLFGGVWGMLYSIAGAAVSLLVMAALLSLNMCRVSAGKEEFFSIYGVSMAGGVFHNLGQLCVAMLALSSLNLAYYGTVLILSGMVTGLINALIASLLLRHMPRVPV